MHQALEFVLRHGYVLLFCAVLAEQIGLPVPALPVLLAMGALSATGEMHYIPALLLCMVAALAADLLWYGLGRRRGGSILNLLCRISLEPDSCVRRTENIFLRYGSRALLFAKFVPGLSTAAPPLAGMFRLPVWKFVIFDSLGALTWAGSYSALGWIFRAQMNLLLDALLRMGSWVLLFVASLLALYILFKYIQRRRFYHTLRVARITPHELQDLMNSGVEYGIVDLRNSLEREDEPMRLPGALAITFEELEARHTEIPRDRDIILYCT